MHTPGPWQAVDLHIMVDTRRDGRAITIAKVDQYDFGIAAAHDNARLIAAAPDLLTVLETVQMAIDADGLPPGWGIVQAGIRSAIAKATGK